ncbi:MAG TPA: RNA methyltransferase [Bacillales bacterium]|nr:RNA methyltransferase [Bacillales bacterium]
MKRIESKQNPHVKEWKKLLTKKGRNRSGRFLIEGPHLVQEALNSGVEIEEWIVEEGGAVYPFEQKMEDRSLFVATSSVIKEISETTHSQGIFAVCRMNEQVLQEELHGGFLLVDGVQDPGNVGTMIRTADAAGLSGVILGQDCVDLYNGKVLRATQGSLFHLPVLEGDLIQWMADFKDQGVPVFGTALQGGKPYTEVQSERNFALIVGNESNGVRAELLEEADESLYIPIHGQAESLNVSVAAGILMYGLRNQA